MSDIKWIKANEQPPLKDGYYLGLVYDGRVRLRPVITGFSNAEWDIARPIIAWSEVPDVYPADEGTWNRLPYTQTTPDDTGFVLLTRRRGNGEKTCELSIKSADKGFYSSDYGKIPEDQIIAYRKVNTDIEVPGVFSARYLQNAEGHMFRQPAPTDPYRYGLLVTDVSISLTRLSLIDVFRYWYVLEDEKLFNFKYELILDRIKMHYGND